jgi:hypothetical protein
MNPFSLIYSFFDKLEDHIRGTLSRHAFIYTFIGGTGLVLFWRGIWHVADALENLDGIPHVLFSPMGSVILGSIILLSTGLFVSVFVGDSIIMSGIRKDKKIIDKTIDEVKSEKTEVEQTLELLVDVKKEVDSLTKK